MAKRPRTTQKPVYTQKESFYAYLVTGWFGVGFFYLYLILTQPAGKNAFPDFFSLLLLSCVVMFVAPLGIFAAAAMMLITALVDGDFGQIVLACALMAGVLTAWYGIRYALYGIEQNGAGRVP